MQAFTLLELLVALGLMNMIALSLYSSLYITTRAKRSVSEAMRPYQSLSPVFDALRQDLQSSMQPDGVLAGGFYGESLTGEENQDSDILQFCCASYSPKEDEIASNIIQVSYEMTVDAARQENVLIRNTTVNLLSSKTTETSSRQVIGRNIRSFNLRYFDGYAWQESWDSTTADNQLPMAVEINLKTSFSTESNPDRIVRNADLQQDVVYRRVYLLPCAQDPTEEQTE